jgi:signal transduction histidine kinase
MNVLTEPQECPPDRPVELKKKGLVLSDAILSAFARVTQSSKSPGFLIDRNHRIVSWNPALEEMTGIKCSDVIGTVPGWKLLYGRDEQSLADLLVEGSHGELPPRDRYAGGEPHLLPDSAEKTIFLPHRGPAGTWLRITASVIRLPNGSAIGAMESLEDITAARRAGWDLSLAERKLKLMGDIAWHEIQNKITGIRGYVELSRDAIKDDIGRSCIDSEEHVLRQIHELLQCTREYNEIGKPHCWIRIGETVSRIVSLMERDSISANLDVNQLELFADPALGKMFSYLLQYSAKTANAGLKIRIYYVEKPDSLELVYEDNGTGIPEMRKKDLFPATIVKSEFFCMTFVHDVLELSGMAIDETGDAGCGARFVISVPKDRFRFG